jgi:hypothetical protein
LRQKLKTTIEKSRKIMVGLKIVDLDVLSVENAAKDRPWLQRWQLAGPVIRQEV